MNVRGRHRSRCAPADVWQAMRLPGRTTPVLLALVAVLSALSLLTQVLVVGLRLDLPGLAIADRYLSVDREMGIPAWFSSLLLFAAAERLWQIRSTRSGDRWRRHWTLLAAAFAYLSLDELTELHEQVGDPLLALFDLGGVLSFAWVVLAVPMVAVFGLLFVRFLQDLPAVTRWAFLVCAACYLGGAVALEMAGSAVYSSIGRTNVAYAAVATVEELLEMAGAVLFLGTVSVVLRRSAEALGAASPAPVEPAGTALRLP